MCDECWLGYFAWLSAELSGDAGFIFVCYYLIMITFDIITIFPDVFGSYFGASITGRAQAKKLVKIDIHNLRDFADDKHKKVDDTPYGGGAGMVLKYEPIWKSVQALKSKNSPSKKRTRIILFSAKGKRFAQRDANRLSKYDNLILICGRYEGVDERVARKIADEEISIGDYVLTGGELPAMVLTDSITRLIPGVLGNKNSALDESHTHAGILEYPQYTKPENIQGLKVPKVLLSGNHEEIKKWREKNSKKK